MKEDVSQDFSTTIAEGWRKLQKIFMYYYIMINSCLINGEKEK